MPQGRDVSVGAEAVLARRFWSAGNGIGRCRRVVSIFGTAAQPCQSTSPSWLPQGRESDPGRRGGSLATEHAKTQNTLYQTRNAWTSNTHAERTIPSAGSTMQCAECTMPNAECTIYMQQAKHIAITMYRLMRRPSTRAAPTVCGVHGTHDARSGWVWGACVLDPSIRYVSG